VLGVELYELWVAGRVELPALAGVYARTAEGLSGVPHDDADWSALRRQLVSVLAGAAEQIREAGGAVCAAADEYARADAGAGAVFGRLRDERPGLPVGSRR
jgi:hypothetical protein